MEKPTSIWSSEPKFALWIIWCVYYFNDLCSSFFFSLCLTSQFDRVEILMVFNWGTKWSRDSGLRFIAHYVLFASNLMSSHRVYNIYIWSIESVCSLFSYVLLFLLVVVVIIFVQICFARVFSLNTNKSQ